MTTPSLLGGPPTADSLLPPFNLTTLSPLPPDVQFLILSHAKRTTSNSHRIDLMCTSRSMYEDCIWGLYDRIELCDANAGKLCRGLSSKLIIDPKAWSEEERQAVKGAQAQRGRPEVLDFCHVARQLVLLCSCSTLVLHDERAANMLVALLLRICKYEGGGSGSTLTSDWREAMCGQGDFGWWIFSKTHLIMREDCIDSMSIGDGAQNCKCPKLRSLSFYNVHSPINQLPEHLAPEIHVHIAATTPFDRWSDLIQYICKIYDFGAKQEPVE
ncbi:hypothetical protein IAT38_000775 [Cryptococcus sp. DSM 104549]